MAKAKVIALGVVVFATLVCVYGTASTLVTETCSKTEKPDTCASAFACDPQSASATDSLALARIGVQVLVSKNDEAFTRVSGLKNEPNYWADISPCFRSYDHCKSLIDVDALTALDNKNFTGAADSLAAAKRALDACAKYQVPQLQEANTFLTAFAADLITIVTSLPPQPTP